ncbi:hypothetical protein D3C77_621060 [compost metagenome]
MPADRTSKASRENHLFKWLVVHRSNQSDTVGQFQRGLEGFGQALLKIVANLEAIDHDFDGVLFLLIQFWQLIELEQLAIDPGTHEALGA